MLETFILPSTLPNATESAYLLISIDCICEPFPNI